VGHDRDLGSPVPWHRSLRAARRRRAVGARRRRRRLRGRAALMLALAGSAIAAAGALAQSPAPPSGGSASAGATHSVVAAVQRALHQPADGVYGGRTRAAVRRYQRRHGLTVDGVLGPETLAELGVRRASDTPAGSAAGAGSAVLARIASCESGGDPAAVSADGQYRGKYQFDQATWERLGGTGDPAAASEAEQDRLAAKLLAEAGGSPWPNCA